MRPFIYIKLRWKFAISVCLHFYTGILNLQMCSSELRRGGSNFMAEPSKTYYGNYSGFLERGQHEMSHGAGYSGFLEGNSSYGSSTGHHSSNNRGMMNSTLLSQFEKIRNEFQMKHSQYVDPASSEAGMLRSNLTQMPWNCSSHFNRKAEGTPMNFQADFHQEVTPHHSRAPGTSMIEEKRSTPNSNFIDDSLNIDLQDLWNSQKLGSFCWPHDKPSSGLDTSINQMFNGLNISEH